MTDLTELQTVARRYQRRVSAVESDRVILYELIRRARADGHSLRACARATGLSFGRIEQITKEPP